MTTLAVTSVNSLLRVEETWEAVGFLWPYPPFPVSCPSKSTVAPRKSPPSQTPPRRITAAGSSGGPPLAPPRMRDPRSQQRMLPQEFNKPLPRQRSPTRAATQPFPPDATDRPIELPETTVVRRSAVILVVAAELGVQGLLLLVHRIVPMLLAPFGDRLQPPAEPLADRPHVYCELPFSATGADVREAEEIKGCRFLSLSPRVPFGVPPKFHQPCLLRVQCQTISREPLR